MAGSKKKDDAETLTVDGREVRVTHPDKPYFSRETKLSKLDLVRYYLSVAPGALAGIRDRPIVLKRFVDGAEGEAFYQKRAPDEAAGVAAHRDAVVSLGPHRRRGRRRRRGGPRLDRQPRLHRTASASGALRRSRPSRRAARRSRSGPGRRVGRRPPRRAGGEGAARRAGPARLAEDQRLARHARQRAHRAALDVHRSAPRGARAVARDRAARARARDARSGGRRSATACSSTTTRTPRIAPPARPTRCARCPTRACRRRSHWDEVPDCEPADFTVLTVPERFAEIGDPHAGMDARAGSLETLLELAARDEAAGLGDAPWPPHFRKMEGEAPRVAPSRARKPATAARRRGAKMPLHRRSRTRRTRRRRWPASSAGRQRHPEAAAHARRRRRAGRLDARPVVHLDPHPREPAPRARGRCARRRRRPTRTTIRRASGARPSARPGSSARPHPDPLPQAGEGERSGSGPLSRLRERARVRVRPRPPAPSPACGRGLG